MSDGPQIEWHRAAQFAEYAEALHTETWKIVAVGQDNERNSTVVYTPGLNEDGPGDLTMFIVEFTRDGEDEILRETSRRHGGDLGEQLKRDAKDLELWNDEEETP